MGITPMDNNPSKTGGNPLMSMGTTINLPAWYKQCVKFPGIEIWWFVGEFLASIWLLRTVPTYNYSVGAETGPGCLCSFSQ